MANNDTFDWAKKFVEPADGAPCSVGLCGSYGPWSDCLDGKRTRPESSHSSTFSISELLMIYFSDLRQSIWLVTCSSPAGILTTLKWMSVRCVPHSRWSAKTGCRLKSVKIVSLISGGLPMVPLQICFKKHRNDCKGCSMTLFHCHVTFINAIIWASLGFNPANREGLCPLVVHHLLLLFIQILFLFDQQGSLSTHVWEQTS